MKAFVDKVRCLKYDACLMRSRDVTDRTAWQDGEFRKAEILSMKQKKDGLSF